MALRSILQAPEFSQKALVQKWLTEYKDGNLFSLFNDHWRVFTLVVFQHPDDPVKEERLADKFLFKPLEYFLCNGDPVAVLKQLKEKDQPSQLCGHVFKTGEPTYSCRECATDPTCVLCIECFQNSVHKKHRYRMSTSGGGGYCDCGDTEAWKTAVFCNVHKPADHDADDDAAMNPMELLPDEITDRASALFLATLRYIVELLTWEQCDSLPSALQPDGELLDHYICMLFNDEVHTYEQVISTLQRAITCSHKEAVEYATVVDREGRSCVTNGNFADCEKVRTIIERNTSRHGAKPLKVQVMHTAVVAHQYFALRMIQWLQTLISNSDGLRRLFSLLSMQQQEDEKSLMEVLLLADTQLWKIARVQSHQLMMSGVLMDQDCKKKFSILFTKHYPHLMKAFCLDDHDHDVSIASLSVQIFTVTSLARVLVTEHSLLTVILETFLQACIEKLKDGKLNFERVGTQTFKRACFMLHDLKYALIMKPTAAEWTDSLRASFLKGYSMFLQLLQMIDGMDPVKRQTGQHIEFEPEWEGAFNLQLKLEDNIALFLNWCGSDRQVLIEAYNRTLQLFDESKHLEKIKRENCSVAGHTLKCLKYDVGSQPISIHLPVTRILAGLHLYFEEYGLSFSSPDCGLARPDPVEVIELPLRVQVMVAQTQAGMWRRNGYALLNQIFFYHNVKCRTEMFDRDIITIQIGASMMSGDDFLVHLLNKFGLMAWVKPEYDVPSGQEDSLRQTMMLAEEFLAVLIIILSERFIPGIGEITKADMIRREVIHQLCIAPMAHSELAKALPEDSNHETGLEEVVRDVAVFQKQSVTSGGGKGKYKLKPECYSLYNPYFYHYSKVDKSKSEEAQVKRRKDNNESQALPLPVPPPFTHQFYPIVNLLQSDVMIHIMELLLTRTVATRSRSWSETQLERVVLLVGLALHEQKRAFEDGRHEFDFLTRACGRPKDSPKVRKDGKTILSLLETAVGCQNISHDSLKDLVSWTLRLLTEVRQLNNHPVSMDLLEQKSLPHDGEAIAQKKKKAAVAAKRRAKIMAQMSAMQKNFIKENSDLFDNTSTELFPRVDSDMDLSETETSTFPVAVGRQKTVVSGSQPVCGTCILCQEEQEITLAGKAMVLTAFVQKSTVLSLNHGNALLKGEDHDPLFIGSSLTTGTHTSSCGHTMHADCWQRFFDAILVRERRRPLRFRHNYSYDIEKMEFLCPLCECISNTVIPILPPLVHLFPDSAISVNAVHISFTDWLDGIHKTVQASVKEKEEMEASEDAKFFYEPCPVSTITKMMAESVAKNFQLLWTYVADDPSGNFTYELKDMLRKISRDIYSFGLGVDPDDDNPRVPIMSWNTCAFTIQSVEQLLRDEGKPLFGQLTSRHSDCVKTLVKFAAVSNQVAPVEFVKEHCIRLLSFLFPDVQKINGADKVNLLDVDMFQYLTSVVMSLPCLHQESTAPSPPRSSLPSGGINDYHALHLIMAVHLVQVLLAFDQDDCGMEVDFDYEGEALLIIFDKLHKLANIQTEIHPLPWQLSVYVRKAMLPFVRCAVLLYHYITGVNPPADLSEVRSDEFDCLCRYLGVNSHMSRLLDNEELVDTLIAQWCKNPILQEKFSASSQPVIHYPRRINKLIELPDDYSELINEVSTFTCPKSDGDDSRAPTMCLVCGRMLCSQSYCCQTEFDGVTLGAATEHAYKCGGGTGIFLRVRECQILLLAGRTKGCFVPPPYIDDYGETDQGLRRGNPLHLCKDSYKHLQKLWMTHAIPETIAHNLESNNTLLAIDWQHL